MALKTDLLNCLWKHKITSNNFRWFITKRLNTVFVPLLFTGDSCKCFNERKLDFFSFSGLWIVVRTITLTGQIRSWVGLLCSEIRNLLGGEMSSRDKRKCPVSFHRTEWLRMYTKSNPWVINYPTVDNTNLLLPYIFKTNTLIIYLYVLVIQVLVLFVVYLTRSFE